jgi:predicted nuclease with TOPRIM domain
MSEQKTETKEELEQQVQQLQYQLNTVVRRESLLATKLGQKEVEVADLTIRLEQVSQGYQSQQQFSQDLQGKLETAEKELINRKQRREQQRNNKPKHQAK